MKFRSFEDERLWMLKFSNTFLHWYPPFVLILKFQERPYSQFRSSWLSTNTRSENISVRRLSIKAKTNGSGCRSEIKISRTSPSLSCRRSCWSFSTAVRVRSFENQRQQFVHRKEYCSSLTSPRHYGIMEGSMNSFLVFSYFFSYIIFSIWLALNHIATIFNILLLIFNILLCYQFYIMSLERIFKCGYVTNHYYFIQIKQIQI